jgi:GDP-L-fucose synthase
MKKILITGAKGFLGKSLVNSLPKEKYQVVALPRELLDISNSHQVNEWFSKNKVDFVIHTAVKGGRRGQPDNLDQFATNINMHNNLCNISDRVEGIFIFGSGAEFDRRTDISKVKEENIYLQTPQDFYGLAKNLITKDVIEKRENFFSFRLFGCFGILEAENRLIKSLIRGIKNQSITEIDGEKEMDFFYVEDVSRAIQFYIDANSRKDLPRDINLVYNKKYTLKEVSDLVESELDKNKNLKINKNKVMNYTGDGSLMGKTFPEKLFFGFEKGLKTMCEESK